MNKRIFNKIDRSIVRISLVIIAVFFSINGFAQEMPGTRQIHLDCHTSSLIPDVAKSFSKKQFQEALKTAHINYINIFAKGDHGNCYYPTKAGTMHPGLDFDLMGAQMEACHEIGIKCPFYFGVGWSGRDADEHPEWRAKRMNGADIWNGNPNAKPTDPFPYGGWKLLCPSGDYHKLIIQQVEELCKYYPADGFWFDIYQVQHGCYCENCRSSMKEKGINMDDHNAVVAHFAGVYRTHMAEIKALVSKYHPKATVYFNGTTKIAEARAANLTYNLYEFNSYQDLEDLPTGWGGYDLFPVRSKYYLQKGYPVCAMSGKFHTSWGEFGGFKYPDALKYEAASMISFGSLCNFGHALHPTGIMDMQTCQNIGEAYKYVEKIEEYGPGGTPVSNLGVWFSKYGNSEEGLFSMLFELHMDFLLADKNNLNQFETLIVPSRPIEAKEDIEAIKAYIKNGGKVLFMADGAMNLDRSEFIFDVGADLEGAGRYDVDYTLPVPELGDNLMQSPTLNYIPAFRTKCHKETQVLAGIYEPYFSRTYEHNCSNRNTPYRAEPAGHPALIKKDGIVFAANALDRMYFKRAARAHRDLFKTALNILYREPTLKVTMPSSGRVNLLHQAKDNRYVAHLLYATPHYRGDLLLIEDLVPLTNIPLELKVKENIKKVTLIPENIDLDFTLEDDYVKVTVPEFTMHCGLVFEY